MLSTEVLRQVRRLQLRSRRAVVNLLGGEYHSAFKGSGLAFTDVRPYQPGDDVRAIDWNVTARTGQPFLKRFTEERELTVLFAVDASASLDFGSRRLTKRAAVAELAALLAFAALHNNDRVGLLHFTDRIERFVPPRKGTRHAQRLLRDILFFRPVGRGTNLGAALDALRRLRRKRAVVFFFSDFRGDSFARSLRLTGRRHDLIAVRIADPFEDELPNAGLLETLDSETGARRLIDTSDPDVRTGYAAAARQQRDDLRRLARAADVDLIDTSTDGGHLDSLVAFFRRRQRMAHRP
ncbi:MAG: DUF58 domain-containing protein [Gemmataceae bacterium]